jgi:hypothetical protein
VVEFESVLVVLTIGYRLNGIGKALSNNTDRKKPGYHLRVKPVYEGQLIGPERRKTLQSSGYQKKDPILPGEDRLDSFC